MIVMSYLLLRMFAVPGVLAISPTCIPCRSKMQDAPGGFVTTDISCDVPSNTVAQPDKATLSAANAAIDWNLMEVPTPIFVSRLGVIIEYRNRT